MGRLWALAVAAPIILTGWASPATAAPAACDDATLVGTPRHDRLVGTDGRDVIAGLGGNDVLLGLGGNDLLCAGPGSDRLEGGEGNDRLLGGRDRITHDARIGKMAHGDRLEGGPGDDLLDGGHDRRADSAQLGDSRYDVLDFRDAPGGVTVLLDEGTAEGDGSDRVVVRSRYEVLGTDAADVVHGTPYPDTLLTFGGADEVRGLGGWDWIEVGGEAGPETAARVWGGTGADYILAGNGPDVLAGGSGRDQVSDEGVAGVDTLRGGPGREDLVHNVVSASSGERADGGPGRSDYIWNTDDADAFPDATMTCVRFEKMRSSGPWC